MKYEYVLTFHISLLACCSLFRTYHHSNPSILQQKIKLQNLKACPLNLVSYFSYQ